MGDDAVGLVAARRVAEVFPAGPDVVEANIGGFALLELLSGYERVLILDAMRTGTSPPGTVVSLTMEDLGDSSPPAPHFISLPDVSRLARELNIPFPSDVCVLGLEIADPFIISESLSRTALESIPHLVEQASSILQEWGFARAKPPDSGMDSVEKCPLRNSALV